METGSIAPQTPTTTTAATTTNDNNSNGDGDEERCAASTPPRRNVVLKERSSSITAVTRNTNASENSESGEEEGEDSVVLTTTNSAENPYALLNKYHFRKLGLVLLVIQLLASIAFSWYSWYIDSINIVYSFTVISQAWFVLTTWKISIPHADNAYLCRISVLLAALSLNGFLHDPSNGGLWFFFVLVIVAVVILAILEITKKCWWQSHHGLVEAEEQLARCIVDSLMISFKASVLILYFQAEAVGATGNRSLQEILDAEEFLEQEIVSHSANYYTYEERMEAVDIYMGQMKNCRALVAGGLLNFSVFLSVFFPQVTCLSFIDLLTFQLTTPEAVLVLDTIGLVVSSLVFLGLLSSISIGFYSVVWTAAMFSTMFMGCIAVVCIGLILHSLLKEYHPFVAGRRYSLSHQEKHSGGHGDSHFLISNE